MRCPVCQQALHEHAPACPHCGFDLPAADRYLGMVPRLQPDLSDLADVLDDGARRSLLALLRDKERRFPQLRFAIITAAVPQEVPLRGYVFWILNKGSLASQMEKGGGCRLVLLFLDPVQERVCCMVGYGLEPFVGQATLDRIVQASLPRLRQGNHEGALTACLHQADTEFAAISRAIPSIYGLHEDPRPSSLEEGEYAY